jgi:hypothetical protein
VPTEIVFATGASIKVTATVDELARKLEGREWGAFETARFAGFRGEEAVAGERVVINVGAVAYATEISGS